ncbi:MAG: hypothetical protein JO011_17365 [Ktedonobacteraceae bacterium]|nr:hypothetical protein [Ktedonobacteraceae bacterium]
MKKRTLVAGIFDDADSAVDAIHELRRSGFSDDQLGFVVRLDTNEHNTNALAEVMINALLGNDDLLALPASETNTSAEHNKSAAVVGEKLPHTYEKGSAGIIISSVIGGALGTVAALQLPVLGPVVAGGILAATLAVAASEEGTPIFLSIGIPAHKIRSYEQRFQAGYIILTIKANQRLQEALDTLRYHRACSIEVH